MPLKSDKCFTVSKPDEYVILWDTTLQPLCKQLKEYDPEVLTYKTIRGKLLESTKYEFTTRSGNQYVIQKFSR